MIYSGPWSSHRSPHTPPQCHHTPSCIDLYPPCGVAPHEGKQIALHWHPDHWHIVECGPLIALRPVSRRHNVRLRSELSNTRSHSSMLNCPLLKKLGACNLMNTGMGKMGKFEMQLSQGSKQPVIPHTPSSSDQKKFLRSTVSSVYSVYGLEPGIGSERMDWK